MLRQLKLVIGLSGREKRLVMEAFCLAGVVRLAMLLFPFRWLAPILGKRMQESAMEENTIKLAAARQIGWVVEQVSRYTPWESKCLVQAIVAQIMLRQYGIANTLYLGVSRDEGKRLIAHAWLRCGDMIITGALGREQFTMVGKFFDAGGASESSERR